jgi:hypothetical protein
VDKQDMKKTGKIIEYILLFIGTFTWSLTMFKSGLIYSYGMGFWGPNGHDGIWHTALIESLSKGTLQMPVFAGENIKNYHIGFDLLLALIYKITHIPVINIYFQIIPPILAILIGLFVYKFVLLWRRSETQAFWATFFVYFSGSIGWVITLMRGGGLNGESLFWAQQSLSTLINPPFALSLLIIFMGLHLLASSKLHPINNKNILLLSLLFGILVQIKIYAGILMLSALLVVGIWDYVKRKDLSVIKIFLIAVVLSILILLPTYNLKSGGLLFQPFWFLENMVSNTDRFYWPKMASALINYKLSGNILKGSLAYTLVLIIFLVGNLGIRLISLPFIVKRIKEYRKTDIFECMFLIVILLGIMIPTLFIQKGNSWNSIQFFYYSLVFLSVFTGIVVGEYIENLKKVKLLYKAKLFTTVVIIFLLSIPTTIATLRHYLPNRPPAKVSNEELVALEFLKKQTYGVVLTIPFDQKQADDAILSPPRPLYLYESTAYVSAITGKQTFLDDEVNLDITGYAWKERLMEVVTNLGNINYLKSRGIDYIYVADEKNFVYKDEMRTLNIYNKDGILIYKI